MAKAVSAGQTAQPVRRKHVPQRLCIACRTVAGKRGLVRLVRTPQGVQIDPTGKIAGRGAYLHPDVACWQTALAGKQIDQALRTRLSGEERQGLQTYIQTMTEDIAEDDLETTDG